ncbi:MAG: hypothetical protein HC825_07685 [Oscillatoriales cyanobacterium RM1_1_9]|nr:hypothetical protein [Oscillatoriales cyanobacterium SM2_3_0]NJO44395.1 hypothetical protein [Oscillatoriales cyanobacterium RM2_1_1]NJO71588.1 hypothetical protein [Oscillatoriales cyanobacterium RM1_1_9]
MNGAKVSTSEQIEKAKLQTRSARIQNLLGKNLPIYQLATRVSLWLIPIKNKVFQQE